MADTAIMYVRATPTVQAVPLEASVSSAEVLHTLRKQGSTPSASIPSQGHARRDCWGRGYDDPIRCRSHPTTGRT